VVVHVVVHVVVYVVVHVVVEKAQRTDIKRTKNKSQNI
jgi:hypothetical protein